MSTYEWSCLACGGANARNATSCVACECPASATAKQVEASRENYVSGGGKLQGQAALAAAADLSALEVLGPLLFSPLLAALFGFWPTNWRFGRAVPNLSIERTVKGLRPSPAAHVQR
jgi:hypothetical protein